MKKLIKLTIVGLMFFNIPIFGMPNNTIQRSKSLPCLNIPPEPMTKEEIIIQQKNQAEIDRLSEELYKEILIKKIVKKIKKLSNTYPIECANIVNLIKQEYNFSLEEAEKINDFLSRLLHILMNRQSNAYHLKLHRKRNPFPRPPSPLHKMTLIEH